MMMMIKHDKKLHTSKSPGKRNTCKNRSENRGRRSPKNIDIFWRIRWLDVDDFFPAGSLAARRISKFDHIHRRCVFASCKSVRKHGRHTKRYMAWRIQVNGMVTYIHGTTRPLGDLLTMVVKPLKVLSHHHGGRRAERDGTGSYPTKTHLLVGFQVEFSNKECWEGNRQSVLRNEFWLFGMLMILTIFWWFYPMIGRNLHII